MRGVRYVNLIVMLISQSICISKHHILHLKYIQFLFVNYSPINLEKNVKCLLSLSTDTLGVGKRGKNTLCISDFVKLITQWTKKKRK